MTTAAATVTDTATAARLLTAADLLTLPDDGNRYELLRGELVIMPPPSFRHGVVTSNFGFFIGSFVREHNLPYLSVSEASAYIGQEPDTVRAADYALYHRRHIPDPLPDCAYIPGLVPELVVGVIAPGYGNANASRRAQMWRDAGVRLVVMAYIATRTIVTHGDDGGTLRFAMGDRLTLDPILPGFACPVADIFAF